MSATKANRREFKEQELPPITWARFIMLAEAAGIKADDEVSEIIWSEDFSSREIPMKAHRERSGKVALY